MQWFARKSCSFSDAIERCGTDAISSAAVSFMQHRIWHFDMREFKGEKASTDSRLIISHSIAWSELSLLETLRAYQFLAALDLATYRWHDGSAANSRG